MLGHSPESAFDILFLCTGNSARSILAEAILTRLGAGRFGAFSAGSQPSGAVHPLTIEILAEQGYATAGYRSKSWEEFTTPDAPRVDFVITVCDRAAGESCPVWPGQPITAHWGIDDPAAVEGPAPEQRAAFRRAFVELERRIEIFTSLPLDDLDRSSLRTRLDEIGNLASGEPEAHWAGE